MKATMPTSRGESGHEPAITFGDGIVLSPKKEVVRIFYKEMWDNADKSLIPSIFHEDFTFRGSLEPVLRGYEEFGQYVDWVTGVLGYYMSDILTLVEEGDHVSGRLRFHGYHREEMFGIEPTGRHVWWFGAPTFSFDGQKVQDLWVLGDIHGLIQRLRGG